MVQALPYLIETASQTAGPYVHIGLAPAAAGLALRTQEKPNVLVSGLTEGERIRIEGRLFDGAGALLAGYTPAPHAPRVDPLVTLRAE